MVASHRLTRRHLFARGALAIAGLAGVSLLAACGQQQAAAPAPGPLAPVQPARDAYQGRNQQRRPDRESAGKPDRQARRADRHHRRGPVPEGFKEAPSWPSWSRPASCRPSSSASAQEPLVVKPLHEIGKYGGTWRRGFTGPGDKWNGNRAARGPDQPAVLGLHRREDRPEHREGLGGRGRRQDARRSPCARA